MTSYERVTYCRSLTQHNRLVMLGDYSMTHKRGNRLEVLHPECAGIDIGKAKHYVAVGAHCCEDPVRHFGAFTDELEALGQWLMACGVRVVAMESTGVY